MNTLTFSDTFIDKMKNWEYNQQMNQLFNLFLSHSRCVDEPLHVDSLQQFISLTCSWEERNVTTKVCFHLMFEHKVLAVRSGALRWNVLSLDDRLLYDRLWSCAVYNPFVFLFDIGTSERGGRAPTSPAAFCFLKSWDFQLEAFSENTCAVWTESLRS